MTSEVKILVVEDEYITAKSIATALQNLGYTMAGIAISYSEAMNILKTTQVDFAILDINLEEEKTGIDIAQILKDTYKIPYIFLTAYNDSKTLKNALKTSPYGYLVKPYQEAELFINIEIALEKYNTLSAAKNVNADETDAEQQNALFIKDHNVYKKIAIADVVYAESQKNYLHLQLENEGYRYRCTLKEFQKLITPNSFLKTHRAFVANKQYITGFNSAESALILGNKEIPVSRKFKENVLLYFNEN